LQVFSAMDSTLDETGSDLFQCAAHLDCIMDGAVSHTSDRGDGLRSGGAASACDGGFDDDKSVFCFFNNTGGFCRHVSSPCGWVERLGYCTGPLEVAS